MPNLPAPYVSPWKELARNLRALWADLKLRIQELWRRNREGDLSVPGFWPTDLAPLFWPVLLALFLALLISAGVQLFAWRASSPPPASVSAPPAPTASGSSPSLLPVPVRELPAQQPLPVEDAESSPVVESPQSPVVLQLDPLLDLFLDGSAPSGVLKAARPESADNRLVLVLDDGWWQLIDAERSTLADGWLERSRLQGYSTLHLVDGEDRLLGRSARVGAGMILFNDVSPA